jgi:hypothetical protein
MALIFRFGVVCIVFRRKEGAEMVTVIAKGIIQEGIGKNGMTRRRYCRYVLSMCNRQ